MGKYVLDLLSGVGDTPSWLPQDAPRVLLLLAAALLFVALMRLGSQKVV